MKISKRQFDYFKKRCEYWKEFWGLKNWDIRYKFGKVGANEIANMQDQLIDHLAWIILDNEEDWEVISDKYLDRIAFHEIDEVRHARIESFANARFLDPMHVREAIHELITQEENVILNKPKKEDL